MAVGWGLSLSQLRRSGRKIAAENGANTACACLVI
jgi:hypothetical protein